MAKIPEQKKDLTLLEVDKALEEKKKLDGPRHYLGMSQIGEPCWRKLFYSFRNAEEREFSASGIKAIEDGFLQEDVMAERLRLLPFIKLFTEDPHNPGNQIGYKLLLDHFRGHSDGMIQGIIEAPGTWHVWEHKSVNQTKFNKLKKLIEEKGEKNALIEWDEIYYGQSQIYMHESKTTRHYLTVSTPGGREYLSCRTEYNKSYAEGLIEKAKAIIFDNFMIPAKLSENREFFKCKWCESQGICHDGEFPLVHCKTCRYSKAVNEGKRECLLKETTIEDTHLHLDTCSDHVYNPALISAKLVEHQEEGCLYKTEDGLTFANHTASGMPKLEGELHAIFTSKELREKVKSVNNLKNFGEASSKVQKEFTGDLVSEKETKAWDKPKFDERLKDI